VGTVSEWFNKLGVRLGVSIKMNKIADRILRLGKYVLLFLAAYFTMISSELWCKKLCPYFGPVSGFNVDTVLLLSLLTMAAVIIASIFFKKFWCKYFCFLGALSNVFANILVTGPIILLYLILLWIGVKIPLFWLLLVVIAATALTEALRFKFFSISPFKVKRSEDTCTSCKVCDDHCPEGIEVSDATPVTHPDCTLCLDCVKSCPVNNTLKVKGGKWMPVIVMVVVIGLSLILAKQFPMATLSERWGNYEEASSMNTVKKEVFEDLSSLHCYGTAVSLKNKVARTRGIVGLDVWASKKKAIVYYDTTMVDLLRVKRTVFSPSKYNIQKNVTLDNAPESLIAYRVGIWELFDGEDNIDVYRLLMKNKGIYGFYTEFGEPVIVVIYMDPEKVKPEEIKDLIEVPEYEYMSEGKAIQKELDFSLENEGEVIDTVTYLEYRKSFFSAYDRAFNKYNEQDPAKMNIFEIDFVNGEDPTAFRRMGHLTSHMSFEPGTVRIKTEFRENPILQVYFMSDSTNADNIMKHLNKEMLTCLLSDGSTKEYDNVFIFKGPFTVKAVK
jgi:ferredoxin